MKELLEPITHTIGTKLGGITAIVAPNLTDVELVGVGSARVSWSSMWPGSPRVNYIETNPFDVDTGQKVAALMEKVLSTVTIYKKYDKLHASQSR